jgi:hypothetical protein
LQSLTTFWVAFGYDSRVFSRLYSVLCPVRPICNVTPRLPPLMMALGASVDASVDGLNWFSAIVSALMRRSINGAWDSILLYVRTGPSAIARSEAFFVCADAVSPAASDLAALVRCRCKSSCRLAALTASAVGFAVALLRRILPAASDLAALVRCRCKSSCRLAALTASAVGVAVALLRRILAAAPLVC